MKNDDKGAARRSEALRQSIRNSLIGGLKQQAAKSLNPLYAWRAIYLCLLHEMPFPDWTTPYLHSVAIRLMHLAARSGGDTENQEIPWPGDQFLGGSRPLSAAEAATGAAWALGLNAPRRGGRNAFARLANDTKGELDQGLREALEIREGRTGLRKADDIIAKRRNLNARDPADTDRSLRRRRAKGRIMPKAER